MAFNPIDIERLIMEAHYKQTVSQPSACSGELTDMEREQYQNRIRDLLDAVQTLLDSNKSLGDRLNDTAGKLDQANSQIDTLQNLVSTLQQKINKLEGQKASHNRTRYGKNSEKSSLSDNDSDKGKTKVQEEEEYIENEGEIVGSEDDASLEEESQCEPAESPKRDLSKRPDHYETMHDDICVVHECDIDKLSEMGLEFIRYTRPVDQIDRISAIRQDRYLYAWVRDKNGNEFPFFIPKEDEKVSRKCVFVNESSYDYPRIVPHTSVTSNGLSDFAVNRFQYAISSCREMYRMINEKLKISQQTILNWLTRGGEYLEGILPFVKKKLLRPDSVIYCDESWVETKVKGKDGRYHYVKRYMWVIVNLTTQMCYYVYGSRKKSVIREFLEGFTGTLMTDAYAAYKYFSKLKDCLHVCCWAHVRRIYFSALKDYKDKLSQQFIDLIGILYRIEIEHILHGRTASEIVTARKLEAIPILNELKQKADELLDKYKKEKANNRIIFSDKLHQALTYMTNNWSELSGYIMNGNVLIDNNVCERAVRPFTNLRKSFGGFSSEREAQTAARYLTIVETCKLMKKTPLDFFRSFFDMIVEGRRDYENMSQALLCVK